MDEEWKTGPVHAGTQAGSDTACGVGSEQSLAGGVGAGADGARHPEKSEDQGYAQVNSCGQGECLVPALAVSRRRRWHSQCDERQKGEGIHESPQIS